MSNFIGGNCPQPINCCPAKCPVDQVICINCCVPISVTCDGASTQVLFQSINSCDSVDGLICLSNESCPATLPGCTITIFVEQRGVGTFPLLLPANEVEYLRVTDLISISLVANGANTSEIVRGKADLQLRKKIQLDC